MFYRKDAAVALAVSVALACAGYAKAESASTVTLDAAAANPAEAAPQGLLMQGLDRMGAGPSLKSAGLNVYGHVEAGYLYNPNRSDADIPSGATKVGEGNVGHVFTANPRNDLLLNQIDLTVERRVDLTKWDLGGKLEVMYGTDARYIHAYGETLYDKDTLDRPYAQFDFTQYYVDGAIPVGNGLKLRLGKMVSHMEVETIDPTTNAFYSHSFIFNFGGPATESGIFAMYKFNDQWSAMLGLTRGDDVSIWKDSNDCYNLVGQVGWVPMKGLQLYFNFDVGSEPAFGDPETIPDEVEHSNREHRQIYNIVAKYDINEKWSVALDGIVGCQALPTAGSGGEILHNSAGNNWYGVALYTGYVLNDYVTLNARAEWFKFSGLTRFAVVEGGAFPDGFGDVSIGRNYQNLWEVTLGATITPMPKNSIGKNLKLRPEVRYDTADDRLFSGGSNDHQVTIGGDVIFTF